jgi:hypothetical protein
MAKGSYCHAKGSDFFTGGVEGPIRAAGLYEITRRLSIQYFKNSVYYETMGFGKPEACST